MLTDIFKFRNQCEYDFTHDAYEHDPMWGDFEKWKPLYKLKWAIARALKPSSILEIGVRYGYSAFSFLDAVPDCEYLGVDNDSDSSGGVSGSLAWAQQKLKKYKSASAINDNSQTLDKLPGETWDLVHVDGQQTGVSTKHDLSLALEQARWILIDGYWWTSINFRSINEWLWDNRASLDFHIVINDVLSRYGDVLIKVGE